MKLLKLKLTQSLSYKPKLLPNSQVTYLSQLWGGRVSDKQITRESGLLELLEAGDNVMVDRGFDIAGIVPDGVAVNMPPFFGWTGASDSCRNRGNTEHRFC